MSEKELRLTQYSQTSGWASKVGPKTLSQVLRQVDFDFEDKNILVGLGTADDAIVYKIDDEKAIIQSVDFFTPVVDDPFLYGQVAATNALSDIYAMGGKPFIAMNIVGFPSCLEDDVLVKILKGGAKKVKEAGATIAGGHTVKDDEPKYGLSVSGFVHPDNILANSNAQIGDKLILTKEIGTGIHATAIKAGLSEGGKDNVAVKSMLTLNDKAVDPMQRANVNSCTDVTGFGLLGHAVEMANGSNAEMTIFKDKVQLMEGTREYAEQGLIPGGGYDNKDNFIGDVEVGKNIDDIEVDILFDPQTSGGLLISVPEKNAESLLNDLHNNGVDKAVIIGEVTAEGSKVIVK